MTVMWNIAPCSLVEIVRHFRGAYYLYHQGGDIAQMMEAVCTSEMTDYYTETTRYYVAESCHLCTCRLRNRKSHT
jgi:hypothetical protein